ncbi:hemolysin family protein [Flavobacteriaceae bacterium]|nr:hemolysin family protein [Flavobacteriaceae bacterium]
MEESLLIIFISLLFSAFFSGMEIAYVSANKIHLEIEKKQNNFIATVLKRITLRPSKFIATMLVGNNIALVIYGLFMGEVLMHWVPLDGFWGLMAHTFISTLVILWTAEFLPKVFFQIYANQLVVILSLPAYIFYLLFSVISELVIWISDFILRVLFRTPGDSLQLSFSKVELGHYINEQMDSLEIEDEVDSEIQIFQNALEFSDVKAREVMIPRTEVIGVDVQTTPRALSERFTETGLSKILVYQDNLDNILGYVHSFELFKKPEVLSQVLMPVVFIPETMLAKDILQVLTRKRKSIAVVVDEYGGTAGIITVEDIIEELFGEIEDEHDSLALVEEELDQNRWRFSARLEVDYLNETYKLDLPESEQYETLGGLIVHVAEEIPEQGEVIDIEDFTLTILEVSNTKIELVELARVDAD